MNDFTVRMFFPHGHQAVADFKIKHLRNRTAKGISPKGGYTILSGKKELYIATCHPNDTFKRKEGIKIAFLKYAKRMYPNYELIELRPSHDGMGHTAIFGNHSNYIFSKEC